ncbi:hypothetical protein ABKN59_005291 [Abortiporus biennis]
MIQQYSSNFSHEAASYFKNASQIWTVSPLLSTSTNLRNIFFQHITNGFYSEFDGLDYTGSTIYVPSLMNVTRISG